METKKSFEEVIKENEEANKEIRDIFFPLIRDGLITGYNIYKTMFEYVGGTLFLNYLHSDLSPKDRHYNELTNILEGEGLINKILNINHELIDSKEIKERNALYLTKPEWEDSPKMRYFLFNGTEIPTREAEKLGIDLIGEVMQYDMLFKIKNELELRKVIDLFKKYVAKFKIDNLGKKMKDEKGNTIINNDAIHKAWDIPLLICTTINNKKPSIINDFLRVNQFNIDHYLGNIPTSISTIVRKTSKDLKKFLISHKINFDINKKYVLRTFIEDYIKS